MRIGIVGAGATGAYLAARFAAAQVPVTLAARGESAARIAAEGITIVDGDRTWNAHPAEVVDVAASHPTGEPVDVVLVCVKTPDTRAALPVIERLRGPATAVLSLQNGVRMDAVIAAEVGAVNTLSGVLYIGAHRRAPGVIDRTAPARVLIGPYVATDSSAADAAPPTTRAARVVEVFRAAGLETTLSAAVSSEKWQKFLFNCGLNPLTALTGRKMAALLEDPFTRGVFRDLLAETAAVGRASGAPLDPDAEERALTTAASMNISSSMAEDLRAGRVLELDAFSGHVLDLAGSAGVHAPVTATVHALLRSVSTPP